MRLYISDLKPGDILSSHKFAVKDVNKKTGKNDTVYYDLTLADRSGEINAKIWQDAFKNCDIECLKIGTVIEVHGRVDSYNDSKQISIDRLKKADSYNPSNYLKEGKKDREKLFNNLLNTVKELEDKEVSNLILTIFEDENIVKKYKEYPAAEKVHHAYIGGLLEHICEMVLLSLPVKKLYPQVNYSELMFGILFHDIGKLFEYTITGVSVMRNTQGYLIGHITQGVVYLNNLFPAKFDQNKKDRLLHLILSHHGKQEYGSPVVPQTIEGVILSLLDDLSSQATIALDHLEKETADEQGMTPFNKYLNTGLLKPFN
jgi:3'-5' exoribonuclease